MPIKKVPASITYDLVSTDAAGVETVETQYIDFHAVVSENHEASATVTKYPVQTGLHISNHSIRRNRVIRLVGVITNIQMTTATNFRDYGIDAVSLVKESLTALVQGGIECVVTTNSGVYNPVVLTKFTTSQKAGFMDSAEFTITGEEIVKIDTANKAAPALVNFTNVTPTELPALKERLENYGVHTGPCSTIKEASVNIGDDFILQGFDALNNVLSTTYKYTGRDTSTGEPKYTTHLSKNAVELFENDYGQSPVIDGCGEKASTKGGIQQIGECLVGEAIDIALDALEETVDTAMGELTSSIYGFVYDNTTFGSEAGSLMARAGIGCVVRGALGKTSDFPYIPGESLPTTDQILESVKQGLGIVPVPEKVKMYEVTCGCSGKVAEDITYINVN